MEGKENYERKKGKQGAKNYFCIAKRKRQKKIEFFCFFHLSQVFKRGKRERKKTWWQHKKAKERKRCRNDKSTKHKTIPENRWSMVECIKNEHKKRVWGGGRDRKIEKEGVRIRRRRRRRKSIGNESEKRGKEGERGGREMKSLLDWL